jgi:hypothetical protein
MKLYTNGCSMTQGCRPFTQDSIQQSHGGYSYWSEKRDFVWPWVLEEHFDIMFNHAKMATGLDRTLRSTLDFVEHMDPCEYNEWIFVIQVSDQNRVEYLCPTQTEEIYGQVLVHGGPDLMFIERDIASPAPPDISCDQTIVRDFHLLWQTDRSFEINQAKNIMILQSLLKSKGIRYLVTAMNNTNLFASKIVEPELKLLNNLEAQLDSDHIIISMEEMLAEYPRAQVTLDDGHPNTFGNTVIADYIYSEMEKRNWLS